MDKTRIGALVIGIIMITSVAGFAVTGLRITGGTASKDKPVPIPVVSEKLLTGQEIAVVLSNGRVIFESVYNSDCIDCKAKDGELRTFASQYGNFLILETVESGTGGKWEKFQMIGRGGTVIDLANEQITQDSLLELLCQNSLIQPRECLLKAYDRPTIQPNSTLPPNETNQTGPIQNPLNQTFSNSTNRPIGLQTPQMRAVELL